MKEWKEVLECVSWIINNNNMDWLHIGCGDERSGKSNLGWQSCKEVDPDFDHDSVAFTALELRALLKEKPKGAAIMVDEAEWISYARDALSSEAKWFNKTLMKIGGRNLFLWVNIPDFFSLDPYIRRFRVASLTKTVWWIQETDTQPNGKYYYNMKRGRFEIYDRMALKKCYKQRETGIEKWTAPTGRDSFESVDATDRDYLEYLKRKDEFMKVQDDSKDVKQKKVDKNVREDQEDLGGI